MPRISESRWVAIVALGISFFSVGFSVTAVAYAERQSGNVASQEQRTPPSPRNCARL